MHPSKDHQIKPSIKGLPLSISFEIEEQAIALKSTKFVRI